MSPEWRRSRTGATRPACGAGSTSRCCPAASGDRQPEPHPRERGERQHDRRGRDLQLPARRRPANHVERCYVGIDITGTGPLGNGHQGIYIGEAAHHNVLDQNWVGDNGFDGVGIVGYGPSRLFTHSNTLIHNRIGVDVNLNPMRNQCHGVAIGSYGGGVWGFAPDNVITNNMIAYNRLTGVVVQEDLRSSATTTPASTRSRRTRSTTTDPSVRLLPRDRPGLTNPA